MKRLLAILIVIAILVYAYFNYIEDRRFNPPSDYDYPISEQIDTEFYDQSVVSEYYGLALEIGNFARSSWTHDGVDVRSPDFVNDKASIKTRHYNQMIKTADLIRDRLIESKTYKDQGYTKDQIKMIMEQGITPEDLELRKMSYLLGLTRGANGAAVWELQKMLNTMGDSIPEDGIFNLITTNRLKEFQTTNDLFPSGEVDEKTLKALLK
ncbi:MAG: peptidoglycan-binding protein [Roseivirga sp.]|nr:peptidoglycan-binding protein [Roseivirga sp.]